MIKYFNLSCRDQTTKTKLVQYNPLLSFYTKTTNQSASVIKVGVAYVTSQAKSSTVCTSDFGHLMSYTYVKSIRIDTEV